MRSLSVRALAFAALTAILPAPALSAGTGGFNASQREQILQGIARNLNVYIFPTVAGKVRAALRANEARLVSIDDPQEFAKAVSDQLQASGNDKHLALIYSPEAIAPDTDPTPAEIAHDRDFMRFHNGAVFGVEWLPGNMGYVRIGGFAPDSPDVRRAVDAAMAMVSNTDALIVDLRRNGGGDPSSLEYWMGYFFAKPVELTSIHWTLPAPHVVRQFSVARVNGRRYLKPVYVLTSARTISCGEEFAYDLKALHRATIVGETTAGGANPGGARRLTDHFAVFIPTGRAYNPYTKTNWEHTGVTPDAASSAADALVGAYTLALRSDTNTFRDLVNERKKAMQDPAGALKRVFAP
jgi:hypothetical protein